MSSNAPRDELQAVLVENQAVERLRKVLMLMKKDLEHAKMQSQFKSQMEDKFAKEHRKYVLMQHSEPSPVQRLALTLADRGAQAVANNERLVDSKFGGYGLNARDQKLPQEQAGGRMGKGQGGKGSSFGDGKGGKGKGRGKSSSFGSRPAGNRGWENARAGALLGGSGGQRGWSSGGPTRKG